MKKYKNIQLLGFDLNLDSNDKVLEKIIKGLNSKSEFTHVVSLNPEILVLAKKDAYFAQILREAKISINDGVGIVIASRFINGEFVPRLTGVDMMQKLINEATKKSLRVLLIGGKPNLAEELSNCYNEANSASTFKGITGFKDIRSPSQEEMNNVLSIVAAMRPHLLFVAFGSPEQEKWIYENRASLQGVTCIGVGGAFDFLSGKIKRAPKLMRNLGLEWLYRLVRQPWRWKRQLRLIEFAIIVLKEKFSKK